MDTLRMEFSALNVNFNRRSLDFIGSRKPAHERIKNGTSVKVAKSRYFFDVGQSFVKTVADKHGHAISFHASCEH